MERVSLSPSATRQEEFLPSFFLPRRAAASRYADYAARLRAAAVSFFAPRRLPGRQAHFCR